MSNTEYASFLRVTEQDLQNHFCFVRSNNILYVECIPGSSPFPGRTKPQLVVTGVGVGGCQSCQQLFCLRRAFLVLTRVDCRYGDAVMSMLWSHCLWRLRLPRHGDTVSGYWEPRHHLTTSNQSTGCEWELFSGVVAVVLRNWRRYLATYMKGLIHFHSQTVPNVICNSNVSPIKQSSFIMKVVCE